MAAEPALDRYRPDDRDSVVDLWRRSGLVVPWNDPVADIALARTTGHGDILVLREQDTVVGAVMVGHDGHRGWIYYLAVDPDRRGRGLGRRLVTACEDWVKTRGMHKIQLMVRASNEAVQNFYTGAGYERSDVAVLQRWLGPKANER